MAGHSAATPPPVTGPGEAVSDVYAGDDDLRATGPDGPVTADVLFVLEADPDPDALARITAILALTNQPPAGASLMTTDSGNLLVSIEVRAVRLDASELIRRKLAQLTCVSSAKCHAIGHRGRTGAAA